MYLLYEFLTEDGEVNILHSSTTGQAGCNLSPTHSTGGSFCPLLHSASYLFLFLQTC